MSRRRHSVTAPPSVAGSDPRRLALRRQREAGEAVWDPEPPLDEGFEALLDHLPGVGRKALKDQPIRELACDLDGARRRQRQPALLDVQRGPQGRERLPSKAALRVRHGGTPIMPDGDLIVAEPTCKLRGIELDASTAGQSIRRLSKESERLFVLAAGVKSLGFDGQGFSFGRGGAPHVCPLLQLAYRARLPRI